SFPAKPGTHPVSWPTSTAAPAWRRTKQGPRSFVMTGSARKFAAIRPLRRRNNSRLYQIRIGRDRRCFDEERTELTYGVGQISRKGSNPGKGRTCGAIG